MRCSHIRRADEASFEREEVSASCDSTKLAKFAAACLDESLSTLLLHHPTSHHEHRQLFCSILLDIASSLLFLAVIQLVPSCSSCRIPAPDSAWNERSSASSRAAQERQDDLWYSTTAQKLEGWDIVAVRVRGKAMARLGENLGR